MLFYAVMRFVIIMARPTQHPSPIKRIPTLILASILCSACLIGLFATTSQLSARADAPAPIAGIEAQSTPQPTAADLYSTTRTIPVSVTNLTTATAILTNTATPTATAIAPVIIQTAPSSIRYSPARVALDASIPPAYAAVIKNKLDEAIWIRTESGFRGPVSVASSIDRATTVIRVTDALTANFYRARPLVSQTFAVVAPFESVRDDISLTELQDRWSGRSLEPLYVYEDTAIGLSSILGAQRISTLSLERWQEFLDNAPDAIGILPFDLLSPKYKVLAVNGVNPLDNQLRFGDYALTSALVIEGGETEFVADLLRPVVGRHTNRDETRLTTLLMTGVTAMSRGTAAVMERRGYTYPAEVISGTLRAADITHISNEVPFLSDCVVNNTLNNLQLCSHFNYSATLRAVGTDIVGLSGNHVNDFGRAGARESLAFYRDNGIAIYGSGLNTAEACAPLRWSHNSNTFAFIAALAFEPRSAWATDTEPGACYYYTQKENLLATIRQLAQEVDVVAVELQYLEVYQPNPTPRQVIEFREIRDAGAHIVTGVQSHVPQAMEPYGTNDPGGAGIIVYGLGNLFFDQMWSWETRTELMARHTIYQGQIISTEILTAVLENYAQPRWTTPEERAALLQRVFNAAPARP